MLAPDPASRDAALADAAALGVSTLYPSSLDALAALAPHRVGEGACPTARTLATRLLTLPTHCSLPRDQEDRLLAALQRAARAR